MKQYAPVYPAHRLTTTYAYNSTNQVVQQSSPDGGESKLWYDRLFRLVISQNVKQLSNNYSYTRYDRLGRIMDVGQKNTSSARPVNTIPYMADTYKRPSGDDQGDRGSRALRQGNQRRNLRHLQVRYDDQGERRGNIRNGSTLSTDEFAGMYFDFMLSDLPMVNHGHKGEPKKYRV